MKPFNLEAALNGHPVITKDGLKVTEIYHFKTETSEWPVCAIIEGNAWWFGLDGCSYEHDEYLCLAPVKRTYWVNIYKDSIHKPFEAVVFETKEKADFYAKKNPNEIVGTYPIEIEE